jgi:hypothetical protein
MALEPKKVHGFEANEGGFVGLLEVDRYAQRVPLFDDIISQTHAHFWDPLDATYIDYGTPFDLATQTVLPQELVPELGSAVADRLTSEQRIRFTNESARWWVSGFLHGEQGAYSAAVSLCQSFDNPGAMEYAANQAREEARHVLGFSKYIHARWGTPMQVSPVFSRLMQTVIGSREIYRRLIGIQVLLEGLAMGLMGTFYRKAQDPLLVRLSQLVMTDEAFHHKFGRLWADHAAIQLPEEDREAAEDFALECFQTLMFNVMNPSQKTAIYSQFGLTEEWVRGALRESYTAQTRKIEMSRPESAFRGLLRTLMSSNIVTDRTRHVYAQWVELDGLAEEAHGGTEMMIAAEGLEMLRAINSERPTRGLRRRAGR